MGLSIHLSGNMDQVVVSSLPRVFISKIFRHCLGKNNTPYFANNCFKGVLYFDANLAVKFAESLGYKWKRWQETDKFYHRAGFCFEYGLDILASVNGGPETTVSPAEVSATVSSYVVAPKSKDPVPSDDYLYCLGRKIPVKALTALPPIAEGEVLVLLGAVDKGSATFQLESFHGVFDPAKVEIELDGLQGLCFEDMLIANISYDGQELAKTSSETRGKNMIPPILMTEDGQELELYDFIA